MLNTVVGTLFSKATIIDYPTIHHLNALIFPDDAPPHVHTAQWELGHEAGEAVAFCGWKPLHIDEEVVGFHYRAGVLRKNRGQGLQGMMLVLREHAMREAGLKAAVTYTEPNGAPSMRSLISNGYRPYIATEGNKLAPADRWRRMVHWRKDL